MSSNVMIQQKKEIQVRSATIIAILILLLSFLPNISAAFQAESYANLPYGISLGVEDTHPILVIVEQGEFEGCFATGDLTQYGRTPC